MSKLSQNVTNNNLFMFNHKTKCKEAIILAIISIFKKLSTNTGKYIFWSKRKKI